MEYTSMSEAEIMAVEYWTARCGAAEAALSEAQQRFDDHTKHVGRFLSELYAVMIDPLDSSDLKVAEMTATLLDAAKRDREIASGHADALWTLRQEIAVKDAWGDEAQTTIDQLQQQLSEAQQEIARLADKYLATQALLREYQQQVAQQAATITELRGIVERYGRHECDLREYPDQQWPCTCGFDAALASIPKETT